MRTRAEYEEGFSLGLQYAEADLRDSAAVDAEAESLKRDAREAREGSSSFRAFRLGIVRGYREVTR